MRALVFPQKANCTTLFLVVILFTIFQWWNSNADQFFFLAIKYFGCTTQERGGMVWRGVILK